MLKKREGGWLTEVKIQIGRRKQRICYQRAIRLDLWFKGQFEEHGDEDERTDWKRRRLEKGTWQPPFIEIRIGLSGERTKSFKKLTAHKE